MASSAADASSASGSFRRLLTEVNRYESARTSFWNHLLDELFSSDVLIRVDEGDGEVAGGFVAADVACLRLARVSAVGGIGWCQSPARARSEVAPACSRFSVPVP